MGNNDDETISDGTTTAPASEDTKAHENYTSEKAQTSGSAATSTPGPDGMKQYIGTVGIDVGDLPTVPRK